MTTPRRAGTASTRRTKSKATGAEAPKTPRIPRYQEISNDLRSRIQQAEWGTGDLLPSEEALAADYHVTRMTVRQALSQLAAAGLIERRHGVGTLIAEPKLERIGGNEPIGLAEELEARGVSGFSHVLEQELVRPPGAIRHALWLGTTAKAVFLRRLRYASGVLIGLQESYVPVKLAPQLATEPLGDRSLGKYLRTNCGLAPHRADTTLEAMAATEYLASELATPVGSPLLVASRVVFLADGQPLEHTTGWFLASRYSHRIAQGPA